MDPWHDITSSPHHLHAKMLRVFSITGCHHARHDSSSSSCLPETGSNRWNVCVNKTGASWISQKKRKKKYKIVTMPLNWEGMCESVCEQKNTRVFSELASVAPLLSQPCSSLSGDGVDFPTQSLTHSRGVSPSFWLCSTVITTCLMSLFTYMWDKAKWNFNGLCGELTTMLWHVQQTR